ATLVQMLRRALEAPIQMTAENAGEDGAVTLQTVRRVQKEQNNPNVAFEVISGEYQDMLKAGITDPAKVVRSAVENAASIASMILTTAALITDIPEKEKAMSGPPMPDY